MQRETLVGTKIQLELLQESHQEELYQVAQDPTIWTFTATKAFGDHFKSWFEKAMFALQQNEQIPFIVRRLSDQKILGSSRFYDIFTKHHRLAIGYTWYIPEVWGSFVNPESKLLMLAHAFETLNVNRVEFIVDARNLHSRAAIKKLGATEEGVLRQHMLTDNGFMRDTVMHSIVRSEWPHIKSNLEVRIAAF